MYKVLANSFVRVVLPQAHADLAYTLTALEQKSRSLNEWMIAQASVFLAVLLHLPNASSPKAWSFDANVPTYVSKASSSRSHRFAGLCFSLAAVHLVLRVNQKRLQVGVQTEAIFAWDHIRDHAHFRHGAFFRAFDQVALKYCCRRSVYEHQFSCEPSKVPNVP